MNNYNPQPIPDILQEQSDLREKNFREYEDRKFYEILGEAKWETPTDPRPWEEQVKDFMAWLKERNR